VPAHAARQALLAGGQGWQVVTVLGVTGHQAIPPDARESVIGAIRDILSEANAPLYAVTSLAAGTDQLFAAEFRRTGGPESD
jgi:acetylornithine deacetylase/succinyl-diaminopimelate desuccinylase-like protein